MEEKTSNALVTQSLTPPTLVQEKSVILICDAVKIKGVPYFIGNKQGLIFSRYLEDRIRNILPHLNYTFQILYFIKDFNFFSEAYKTYKIKQLPLTICDHFPIISLLQVSLEIRGRYVPSFWTANPEFTDKKSIFNQKIVIFHNFVNVNKQIRR